MDDAGHDAGVECDSRVVAACGYDGIGEIGSFVFVAFKRRVTVEEDIFDPVCCIAAGFLVCGFGDERIPPRCEHAMMMVSHDLPSMSPELKTVWKTL